MTRPHLSVIMPVKNAAPFIADAFDSIILQDCPIDEVLVVDDGSDDGSMEIV